MALSNSYIGVIQICSILHIFSADYPPPSEYGHRYYSHNSEADDWSGTDHRKLINIDAAYKSTRCIDIPDNLTLCQNMEYAQMRLPNLLEQDTMREVSRQSSSWLRLLQVNCHSDTQIFLCSLFAPICLDEPVWPCRTLCEAVKSDCQDRMLRYGFPWPEMFRCDQYPRDNELCIGIRSTDYRIDDDGVCPACKISQTYDAIIEMFCSSEFALRVKLEQTVITGSDLKIIASKKKRIYKRLQALKQNDIRGSSFYIKSGASCQCAQLDETRNYLTPHLIMGHKSNSRLIVDGALSLEHRSVEVSRAMRAIRDRNACQNSITSINGTKTIRDKSNTISSSRNAKRTL